MMKCASVPGLRTNTRDNRPRGSHRWPNGTAQPQSLFDKLDEPEAPSSGGRNAAIRSTLLGGGGGAGSTEQRRPPRGGAVALPELRALGHHVARAARRARRAEAGAAPHPLRDVAAEPHRRRQAPQVRQGGRRRDGQVPPARRRGDLRRAGADGAGVLAALSAGRRLGQLRLARRRSAPRRCATPSAGWRAISDEMLTEIEQTTVALPAELRRHEDRAGRPAGAHPEPAGQRRDRHRGRDGDQHPAAQPRRGLHRAHQAARQRGHRHRAAVPLHQGPRLPDRRPDPELAGGAARRSTRPAAAAIRLRGDVGHRAGDARRPRRSTSTASRTRSNKAQLVERIADVVLSRKLPQLLDVKDLSTDDVRIALEMKKDADAKLVMAYLFKHTPLQIELRRQPDVPRADREPARSAARSASI